MAAVPALHASVNVSPASITDPDWWSTLGALLRANAGVAERLIVEITEIDGDPRRRRHPRLRFAREGSRLPDRDRRFRLGLHVVPQSAQARRRHAEDRRRLRAESDALRRRPRLRAGADRSRPAARTSRPSPNGCRTRTAAQLLAEWGCDYLQGALIGLATVERPWGDAVPVDRRKDALAHLIIPPSRRRARHEQGLILPPARRKGARSPS